MKKYLSLIISILFLSSCFVPSNLYKKPEILKLDSKTNYFEPKPYKEIEIISDVSVNADTLKSLLVVPNGDYYFEMGKNLNYFKEVMTYSQFSRKITDLGDTLDLTFDSPDKLKLHKAAELYKPYIIMKKPKVYQDENYVWVTGLTIYDPLRGQTIFKTKEYVKYNLTHDVMLALYNNFLDYLRKQQ